MQESYTTEKVLASLGYPDPMVAARQHARMILLGRLARYQALVQEFEAKWQCSLDEMKARYEMVGEEDFASDDAYMEWQWYADAIEIVNAQLAAIA